MSSENVLDVLDRVERAISRVEQLLYGDPQTRHAGLLNEFEGLRKDLVAVRADVASMQRRKPNVLLWVAGYTTTLAAVIFAAVALINSIQGHELWGMPPIVAIANALGAALVSMLLLVGGHGWLRGQ